jgi:hypothetical protein
MAVIPTTYDAADLRARFKARCRATGDVHQNWQIRVHRSLSWLTRGLEFPESEPEARFLYLWIALNSLYSSWNAEHNAPQSDSTARKRFLHWLCAQDLELIAQQLHQHRGLIKRLLGDPYLAAQFWRNPNHPKAKGWAAQDANHLDQHLKARAYDRLLEQTMDRLFILRGQIVHGASTRGSRHNRSALSYAIKTLERFVPACLHITIEHGCNDDWPEICYPPAPGTAPLSARQNTHQ